MNNPQKDSLEQDIASLYQQRKSTIVPPSINTESVKKKNKYAALKPLFLLFGGGFASFGIMAIIGHLSELPKPIDALVNTHHVVEINTQQEVKDTAGNFAPQMPTIKSDLPSAPVLPMRPISVTPFNSEHIITESEVTRVPLANIENQKLSLPTLSANQPKLTYKVMPKYNVNALKSNQQGKVTLGYNINKKGEVINIELLESTAAIPLQRSAKRALSKWRFQSGGEYTEQLQVMFEFTLPPNDS